MLISRSISSYQNEDSYTHKKMYVGLFPCSIVCRDTSSIDILGLFPMSVVGPSHGTQFQTHGYITNLKMNCIELFPAITIYYRPNSDHMYYRSNSDVDYRPFSGSPIWVMLEWHVISNV